MHVGRARPLVTQSTDASPGSLSRVPLDRFSKWDSGRCMFAIDNLSVVGYAFENPVMRSIPWSSSLGRQWT